MSYSRWGSSHWYTFWSVAAEGVIEDGDNAELEVMLCGRFTAAEIRNDVDGCVSKAVEESNRREQQPNESDIAELKSVMLEFLADVDAEYAVAR